MRFTDALKPEDINLANIWAQVAGAVLPPETPQFFRTQVRTSFYAGVLECFKIIKDLENLPPKEASAILTRLMEEANSVCREATASRSLRQ